MGKFIGFLLVVIIVFFVGMIVFSVIQLSRSANIVQPAKVNFVAPEPKVIREPYPVEVFRDCPEPEECPACAECSTTELEALQLRYDVLMQEAMPFFQSACYNNNKHSYCLFLDATK